MSKMHHSRRRL